MANPNDIKVSLDTATALGAKGHDMWNSPPKIGPGGGNRRGVAGGTDLIRFITLHPRDLRVDDKSQYNKGTFRYGYRTWSKRSRHVKSVSVFGFGSLDRALHP